jgi:hypothetical protein
MLICCLVVGAAVVAAGGLAATARRRKVNISAHGKLPERDEKPASPNGPAAIGFPLSRE